MVWLGVLLTGRVALAQSSDIAVPADYAPAEAGEQAGPPPPIPPYVEGPAVQANGGGYCFDGPHPVDATVVPGATWDNAAGRHIHPYPPFDLRLFSVQNGCYYFIGDPTDFGYAGNSYSYYGAHPILAAYGGGWCFMIGPHHHVWRPWSPLFATVGPWFYWEGPYDPFFWTYWPYYHFYYRSHYPVYYAHGAFFRTHAVAPRIPVVPRPPRYGNGWNGGYRGGVAPRAGLGTPGIGRPVPSPRGPAAGPGAPMPRGPAAAPIAPRPMQGGPHGPAAAPAPRPMQMAPHGPAAAPAPRPMQMAPRAPGPSGGFAPRSNFSPAPRPSGGGAHFGGGHVGGGRGRR